MPKGNQWQEDGSLEIQKSWHKLLQRWDATICIFLELVGADGQDQAGIEPTQDRQCYTVVETMTNTMGVPIQKGTLIFWHAVVAVIPRKGKVPDGMEGDDQQADQDHNEGEACQHHLVLCT